ncbi:hypothetical protein [Agrobacterium salinitolerans]|uniref:Uncharacterized protein n=1 Tax=Agrobacterium salinitolerans TaxID=1183413 RepID=A0A9X3KL15_9HYPH|nr:hypothetical protein [Agrobacterium salinitolerans]MCZ7936680.1 hypothetical protein [Agrobacterium salinitolerans]
MSDIINSMWEPLDDANVHPSPDGVAKEDAPNTVPEVIRAMKGGIKRAYLQSNAIHVSTGTGNAYVLTYPKAPEGYAKGIIYWFFADKTNTGAATLNINGLGTKAITNAAGAALIAGQIASGMCVCVIYDGTAFEMQFTYANPTFTGNVTATTFTGSHSGNGAALTALNATNLTTGTVNNTRLPATMTGKTFSSTTVISAGGITVTGDSSITGTTTITGNATVSGSLTQGGNRVLTVADAGAGKALDADLLDGQHGAYYLARGNGTGTQAISTVAGLQAALDNKLNLTGGSLSGSLSIIANWGAAGAASPLLAVRNTGTGEAKLSFGAANRTTNLSTIGQLASGSTRLATNTSNWDFAADGTLWLPAGGRLAGDGNTYWPYFGDWLSNVLSRAKNIRFGGTGWADLRSTGGIFDTNLAPNVLCGVTTNAGLGDNRTLVAIFYRTIQQSDLWGNWYNVG